MESLTMLSMNHFIDKRTIMKKHIIAALALILTFAASCNKGPAEIPENPFCAEDFFITATCGSPDSRTQRDDAGKMYWSPGDEIAVVAFNKSSQKLTPVVKFVATNDTPSATAKFRPAAVQDYGEFDYASFKEVWDNDTYDHIAVYPYKSNLSIGYEKSSSQYSVKHSFAFSQTGVAGTFAPGAYPSLAWSHDSNFSFKHPLGGLKFSVQSENVVKATLSVTFDNNNITLATAEEWLNVKEDGSVSVTGYSYGGDTQTNSLELTPEKGVFTPGEAYYFVCPPSTTVENLTLTLEKADGSKTAHKIDKQYQFKRSTFASMMDADGGCEWKTAVPLVDPAVIEAGKAGGEITFGVKCAAEYEVETDADWLLDMGAEGDALSGTRTHTFVVKRNEGAARSATINVKSSVATVKVTVNQAAGEPLPGYPSIVRHHSALVVNNYSCAHYSVVNSQMRIFKNAHADMMEFTNIFTNSQYRDEPFNEAVQYNHNYYPDAVLDGRRKAEDEDVILKVFAETDAVYPPMTSIGLSSGIEGTTLTIDLKVYAYKAGTYRISAYMGHTAQAMGNYNIYNVSRVHATENPNAGIAGQEYELQAGMNTIHLTKTIKATYANNIPYLFVFAYVQVPFGDLPVLHDSGFKHNLYVDNCRYAAVGTTVEPEVN